MARPIKLSVALRRIGADLKKKREAVLSAARIAVDRTIGVAYTKSSKDLSKLTDQKVNEIRKNSIVKKGKIEGSEVKGSIRYTKADHRPRVNRLKSTKVIKGFPKTTKGTKGSPGVIRYKILGKTISRRGIVIKGNNANELAVSYKKSGNKYKRIPDPVKTVKSGKNKGKRYTSAKVFKITGSSVRDGFRQEEFRVEMQDFIDEKLESNFIAEFERKGIFSK